MEIVANNYKKGSAFPPRVNPKVLRIYSFQPCPFAERALLVLDAKGIEHEVINVNLRDSAPEWLSDKNPVSKVPIIEFDSDNKLLTESLIVSEYLDEAYPGRQLRAEDPYQRARDKVFIELISPYISVYGKALYSKDDVNTVWNDAKESLKKGEETLKKRKTEKFLSGNKAPGLTDYMIWPFIERIPLGIEILTETDSDEYIRKELPTIHEYRQQMLSDSTIKKVCLDYQVLQNFVKAARKMLLSK